MIPAERRRTALLLIHGFPHDRALWKPQVEGLKDLVLPIAPDLRGFGDSGEVPDTMTMSDYASDLRTLLSTMKVDEVVLCGLSMGGYIALAFLSKYPELVRGLVLCNTRATADDAAARKKRQALARKVLADGTNAVTDDLIGPMLGERALRTRPDIVNGVKAMLDRQAPRAVAAAAKGMAMRQDRSGMLSGITVPTLIITGADDRAIPVAESEAMHKAIPGSELTVIRNVGHLSNLEDPATFNAHLRLFLISVGLRSTRNVA
ncbi:MAG: alpha/beta hydrolase [Flavobacteriales bacterium]|nr:alpha/beta hydrolase [Flavobacteriales bacterium]